MSPGHLYAQVSLGVGTWPGSVLSPWSCLGTSRALPPGGLRSRRLGQSTGQGPSTHSGICFSVCGHLSGTWPGSRHLRSSGSKTAECT